ncbi:hypothetical protein Btru_025261 [Bulinus truncatus]|nr:hypothetical protein Btru_025261 [Bulinus truncatus]
MSPDPQFCEFYVSDVEPLTLVYNLTVKVNISRPNNITSSHSRKTFDLYQHIVPSSVVNLALKDVNSSAVAIRFNPSVDTKHKIRLMHDHDRPLSYKVTLQKSDGVIKGLCLKVKFNKTVYMLSKRGEQNVAVVFPDLDPHTNYSVSLTSVGGGGESPVKIFNFTTKKSAPHWPPSLEPFSSVRVPYFDMSSKNKYMTCFYLLWKPLPAYMTGGDNLFYKIEVSGESTAIYNRTENFLLEHLPEAPHHVKIWAANEVGQSEHFSQISVPDYTDSFKVFVELDKEQADVYIRLDNDNLADLLAIHWCASEKSSKCNHMDICKGSLHTKTEKLMAGKNLHYPISLMLFCKKVTCTKVKTITYLDYEKENDGTMEAHTAQAQVEETSYIEDHKVNNDYSNTSCSARQELCNQEDTDAPTKSFFVSIQRKGVWNGMVPAHCYYHRSAKTVHLDLSHVPHSDKRNFLNIKQQCDMEPEPSKAKQFFPKNFEIYNSPNGSCELQNLLKEKPLAVIRNTNVFSPIVYELPHGLFYLCVVATGQDKRSATPYQLTDEPNETSVLLVIIVTTMLVILVIAGIILLGYLMKRFIDRKKYFGMLQEGLMSISSLTEIDAQKSVSDHSDDSGHGTFRNDSSQDSSSTAGISGDGFISIKISPNVKVQKDSGFSFGDPAVEPLLGGSSQVQDAVKCADFSSTKNGESSDWGDSGQTSESGRELCSEGTLESAADSSDTTEEVGASSSSSSSGDTGHQGMQSSDSSDCCTDGYGGNGFQFEAPPP